MIRTPRDRIKADLMTVGCIAIQCSSNVRSLVQRGRSQ